MEECPLGNLLKDKRTSVGVSLEQVARDTNIPPYYLKALEEEQFEKIPGKGYVKGFLRTYSNYLELDPDPLVDLYNGRHGNGMEPKLSLPRSDVSATRNSIARLRWHFLPTTTDQRRDNLTVWLIICAILLAMWILYYYFVIRNTAI